MSARTLTLAGLVELAAAYGGDIERLMADPEVQFGTNVNRRVGASLLPEQLKLQNTYVEEQIRYRTLTANAGARHSKPQYKGSELVGSFNVTLFNFDLARDVKGDDLDTLKRVLRSNIRADALAQLAKLMDRFILRGLVDANEFTIWQALVDGVAHLRGDNGYSEDVDYPNPDGHRVTAGGDWTDPNYDPFLDLKAGANLFSGIGFLGRRTFAGTPVVNTLCNHPKIIGRTLSLSATVAGVNTPLTGIDLGALNGLLVRYQIPPIEVYDELGRLEEGEEGEAKVYTRPFLRRDALVMTAATDTTREVDLGDGRQPLQITDTVGYVGMGIPSNREAPGRAYTMKYNDEKGGGVDMTGWQTSAPVITEPEAVFAISGITTGA